jgi:hypothetical protein|tara:strand:+ start:455 stop:1087 length:633 start_codon:yes stop_codon:yes gene_type:complete
MINIIVMMMIASPPQQFNTLENIYNDFMSSPVTYEEVIDEAIYNCRRAHAKEVDPELLEKLMMIEIKHGVPPELRGMLMAAACHESGYNPNAEGDHKFDKRGRPKAIGMFQMWPWWTRAKPIGYAIDRTDPLASAEAFMAHIKRQIPKVKKRCKYRTRLKTWVAAWVHAIRKPKPEGRCYEKPKHYRLLRKWHREIYNKRKKAVKAGDGC